MKGTSERVIRTKVNRQRRKVPRVSDRAVFHSAEKWSKAKRRKLRRIGEGERKAQMVRLLGVVALLAAAPDGNGMEVKARAERPG